MKKMFPSWDSIEELEAWHEWAEGIGHWWPIIIGAIALVLGAIWTTYNRSVDHRLATLTAQRDAKQREGDRAEIEDTKALARDTQKQIPVIAGMLTPGDGDTPVITKGMPSPDAMAGWPPDIQEQIRQEANQPVKVNAPADATTLYLGNAFTWTQKFPYAVMAQANEDMMVLDRDESGNLSFSAKFFDSEGRILCEIDKNQFQRNPNNTWKIVATPHRLTLYNDEARMVVDVEYVNHRAIRILGDFYLRKGLHVVITDGNQSFGNMHLSGGTQMGVAGGAHPVAIWVDKPDTERSPSAIRVVSPGADAERRAKEKAAKAHAASKPDASNR